jgi:hypothetical protein
MPQARSSPASGTPLTTIPDMWFRVLIKTITSKSGSDYKWHEMTFCFRWDLERCTILCIGVDTVFQSFLQDTLNNMWSHLPHSELASLLVPLIETIIAMHDQSVWSVRDVTRGAEKVTRLWCLTKCYVSWHLHLQDRLNSTRGLNHFVQLHEAARHAIHSTETLSVTVDTVSAIQQHALNLSNKAKTRASEQIRAHLESQTRMLQNLLLRSQSNKERLHNEIALVRTRQHLQ